MKSKGGGRSAVHYNAEPNTSNMAVEKHVSAVNPLSLFGTVANWCNNNSLDGKIGVSGP